MFPKGKIRPQEERRRTIKYSDKVQPEEYTDSVLRCGPINQTIMSSERNKTYEKTKASIPSDTAVENMRDWSIEKKV